MTAEVVSIRCGGPGFKAPGEFPLRELNNVDNKHTPCQLYNKALYESNADILVYVHDDVEIFAPQWLEVVIQCFQNLNCAALGLGGATHLGNKNLYRKPFEMANMARGGYMSNQRDWHIHGRHLLVTEEVAVVDAFFMAVDRDVLIRGGGWPEDHLTHHCLDLWLACHLARRWWSTYVSGIECMHYGGGSSTKPIYKDAQWLQGGSLEMDHLAPHIWLYNEFRDVLPLEVR